MSVVITGVKRDEMPAMWPKLQGFFRDFEKRSEGELTAGQLLHGVVQGTRQCWVALDGEEIVACALTEVAGEENPKRTVTINFCAGENRKEWAEALVDELKAWAAHLGSQRLRAVHRPGWTKELKAMGLHETHRVSEIDLEEVG